MLDDSKFDAGKLMTYRFEPASSSMTIDVGGKALATISADGIMRFTVDADDENAAKFITRIEGLLQRRLTALKVEKRDISSGNIAASPPLRGAPIALQEAALLAAEPSLGSSDVSECLPGWIKTFCDKFEAGEGFDLSHSHVNALAHTLIAARVRNERLRVERDAARVALRSSDEK